MCLSDCFRVRGVSLRRLRRLFFLGDSYLWCCLCPSWSVTNPKTSPFTSEIYAKRERERRKGKKAK